MLTAEHLKEIKEYVLTYLPTVLEQEPRFVYFVEGIVSDKFPRKDEFSRLADELRMEREERTLENRRLREEIHAEIHDLKMEMNQRFEKVDQRFEQVDQRFEQVDQRFEQVDQRFEKVDQRFEGVIQEIRNLRDWVEMIAGRLQTRAGRNLENICAGALRLGLKRPDVSPENILLRQKIKDTDGHVYKPGKEKEVDIWAHDGELLIFEVKSAPDAEDVDNFADKVELVRILNPDKTVSGVFIAVGVEEEVRRQCRIRNIQLIP